MDSDNHNILQFVSAASQALESQTDDVITASNDLGSSIDAIFPHHAWSDVSSTDDLANRQPNEVSGDGPRYMRELLAEAAEASFHDDMSMPAAEEEQNMQFPREAESSLKEHSLAEKVQTIFNFEKAESLRGEWPCYIVRSAIVPGFLYLTDRHVCFYASLPRSQHIYHKSGYLLVKTATKVGTTYQRCFFDLKKDALTWYENATDTYSPLGKIELKSTLSIRQSKKKNCGFRIVTMGKSWHLQADTKTSMIEWLNALHKAVFKAKTNGASFKLSLPFESILDMEQTGELEFQRFLKIRAVGIDDNFVVDEYYFAYFPDIKSTFTKLSEAWERSQHASNEMKDSMISFTNCPPPNIATASPDGSTMISPSLSISDLYDADAQPITIPAIGSGHRAKHSKQSASVTSIVSNALAVPGAIKELLYPPSVNIKGKATETVSNKRFVHEQELVTDHGSEIFEDTSSSEDDRSVVDWLDEKRKSGMKLVYGLLGGSAGNVNQDQDDEDDDIHPRQECLQGQHANSGDINERTRSKFREYFVLPESEKLYAVYGCSLMKTLPCYGKLYISTNHISFNSTRFATKAKASVIIPFEDILRIQKIRSKGYIFHALSVLTRKKKEMFFEFSSLSSRNSCFARLYLHHKRALERRPIPDGLEKNMEDWEAKLLGQIHSDKEAGHVIPPLDLGLPILSLTAEEPLTFKKPERSLHFTCITIGTRGDVQPYIALCKGLMKDGHKCRIATHDEFKDWIEEHNIEFRSIGGDPSELMRLCVENSFFSVNFVVEGLKLFKAWIEELLYLTWEACQETDVIIENPNAMMGIHIAEKLRLPYFRSLPMPMTRTRSFPHPFATPNSPKGRLYNDMTYVLFDHAVWRAIAERTNGFRRKVLHLPETTYEKLEIWKIPYLYCFSPSIVPNPLDWMDWIHCTGYWFLDNPQTGWKPSDELQKFLNSEDKRPIVYIGFGSIIVSNPQEITRIIVEATMLSNVRAIVSKGWSSRLQEKSQGTATGGDRSSEMGQNDDILQQYPDTILSLQSVPHDWLFPQMRAVVHHGGAGTTAAGLRAGVPTIVKPFFADQFFWGDRVEEMGLGLCIKKLTVESLSAALRLVSTDENMLRTAKVVGEKIRSENGVETAIHCIYRDIGLAQERTDSSAQRTLSDGLDEDLMTAGLLDEDQGWTLVDPGTSGSISPDS